MRQNDGSEILGPGDARNVTIGIIHVTPGDDRQSVLTAITTQDRLGRAHIILDLPTQNRAFKDAIDFEGLRQFASELNAELLLVVPQKSRIMNFAERQGFTTYDTLEELVADQFPPAEPVGQVVDADPPVVVVDADLPPTQPLAEVPEPPTMPLPSATTPVPDPASAAPVADKQPYTPPVVPSRVVSPVAPDEDVDEEPGTSPAQQLQPAHASYLPVPVSGGRALVAPYSSPPAFYGPGGQSRRPLRRRLLVTGVALLLVIMLGIVLFRPVADLFFPPTASVTITPTSQVLDHNYSMTAVLGTPDPAKDQVDARALYATSPSQSQTVSATGQGTVPGQQAQGVLTFYNSSTSPQQIAAGTVIVDANGVAVVNDDALTLPGLDPEQGIMGVDDTAHTVNAGVDQNIPANDFNATICCGGTIYVTNPAAFTGGSAAGAFVYVQQSDINMAAQTLGTTLSAQAQAALQRQIHANEALAGSPHCVPLVQSSAQAGQQASSITVTVTSTCFGEVYDFQAVQGLAERNLTQDASQKPGAAYAPVGRIRASVTHSTLDTHGNILLTVSTAGVWVYQFSSVQLRHFASLIAGKNSQDAQTTLLSQPGVAGVSILLTGVDTTDVPGDSRKITVSASAVSGLQ